MSYNFIQSQSSKSVGKFRPGSCVYKPPRSVILTAKNHNVNKPCRLFGTQVSFYQILHVFFYVFYSCTHSFKTRKSLQNLMIISFGNMCTTLACNKRVKLLTFLLFQKSHTGLKFFFAGCENKCSQEDCKKYRKRSVSVDFKRNIYGFLCERPLRLQIDKYLYAQHVWVTHILTFEVPERSKFLPDYACVKDLHKLFVLTIIISIQKGSVKSCHREGKLVTYYKAKFPFAVGSYIDPDEGLLYQFEILLIFENGSFGNGFPFGKGYTVKKKPTRKIQECHGASNVASETDSENCQSFEYPSTDAHKGKPGKRKKKSAKHTRQKRRKRSQKGTFYISKKIHGKFRNARKMYGHFCPQVTSE